MKEMSMSWEERLRIAHQVLEERARQLKEMGISVQVNNICLLYFHHCVHPVSIVGWWYRCWRQQDVSVEFKRGTICWWTNNVIFMIISPDLVVNNIIRYYLKETVTRIGSNKGQDIQIRGEGILSEHCILPVENGELLVMPLPGAVVRVNGEPITRKTELSHGATLRLGATKEFRVSCPMGRVQSVPDTVK